MVIINKITEITSELYHNDILVGQITNCLELNDCLIQIKKDNLEGYSLKYDGVDYPIQKTGRIIGGSQTIYPTFSNQLHEIMGL